MHIYGYLENGIVDLILQNRKRDIDVENKHEHHGVGGRGYGMNWEIGIDIYTLLMLFIK